MTTIEKIIKAAIAIKIIFIIGMFSLLVYVCVCAVSYLTSGTVGKDIGEFVHDIKHGGDE